MLHEEQGHLYVCGDVRMARDVALTLKHLLAAKLSLSEEQVEDYFFQLKVRWLACESGWQVEDPGRGIKTRRVRSRGVLNLKRTLQVAGGQRDGLLEGLSVRPGLAAQLDKGYSFVA